MSATIHSVDFLMALYHQKMSLFDDIQKLNRIAKQARWSSAPDFQNIIVFKEQAMIVRLSDGEIIFTSSNMDRYLMKFAGTLQMRRAKALVHEIEIYAKSFDWLDGEIQLQSPER